MNLKFQIVAFIIIFLNTAVFSQTRDQSNIVDIDSLSKRFNLTVSYNDLSGDIILSDKKIPLKIVPGLSYIELNQKVYQLSQPISVVNGQVLLDRKVIDYLSSKEYTPPKKEIVTTRDLPKDFIVVIDPGHGGKDPGTCSEKDSQEKKIVLSVGLMLKEELERLGATVIMTRSKDLFIPLPERSLAASISDADIFLSLHVNATKDPTVEGVEVFVYRYREQEYENSRAASVIQNISFRKSLLADDCYISMGIENDIMRLQELSNVETSYKLAKNVLSNIIELEKMTNRGIKEANFVVLRNSTCPSILVEMGFLSHAETERKLLTTTYCKSIANRIALGIVKYWKDK